MPDDRMLAMLDQRISAPESMPMDQLAFDPSMMGQDAIMRLLQQRRRRPLPMNPSLMFDPQQEAMAALQRVQSRYQPPPMGQRREPPPQTVSPNVFR